MVYPLRDMIREMRGVGILVAIILSQAGSAPLCQWTGGAEMGSLARPISEASGLAVSRRFPNRVYHINDSGDAGRFFVTNFIGQNLQTVEIAGFTPRDTEDLALGPCGAATDCLFVGDIGDNQRERRSIELIIIEEPQKLNAPVKPRYRVRMRYPDGAYNAESLAVHPNGDVFILTKGGVPRLYRLARQQWMNGGERVQSLEFVAAIDFEKLGGPEAAIDGRAPTSMDIASDGKRAIVLTYRNVFEVFLDFSRPLPPPAQWTAGKEFRRISVEVLAQQEAIAFLPDGKSFLYDSERLSAQRVKLMKCDCR